MESIKLKVKTPKGYEEREFVGDVNNVSIETGEKIEDLKARRANCFKMDMQKYYDAKREGVKQNENRSDEELTLRATAVLDQGNLGKIEYEIYKSLTIDIYNLSEVLKQIPYLEMNKAINAVKKEDPLKLEKEKEEVKKKTEALSK